jgi:methionine synthase I (cobalamin-dependent)
MNTLIEQLLVSTPVIIDGAWGSMIQKSGLQVGEVADGYNVTHPDKVEQVARAYVEAGSQIILTNTFQSNRLSLSSAGLVDKIDEINTSGVKISKRAAGDSACVFASIGPGDKMLMMGQTTEDELNDVYTEQAALLAEAGADGIVIETMSDLTEIIIAVTAARRTGLPVVACMIFDSGPGKDRTMMGVSAADAAARLTEAGADVIGANCGQGIEGFISVCRQMRSSTPLPLWMKANAGLPEMVDGQTVYNTDADAFADTAQVLYEAGAGFIGGCCGTTPEFIRALVRRFRG